MGRIVHLTVLNPASHVRIYHKQALALAEAGYSVVVIGQDSAPQPYVKNGVRIVPVRPFNRMSFRRLGVARHLQRLAQAEKPDIVVVHTPELLRTGYLLKRTTGCRVVYDVHEDYALNLRHHPGYPRWARAELVRRVKAVENWAGTWLDGATYAETCFVNRLGLAHTAVIRNMYAAPTQLPELSPSELPVLAQTGTLAEPWGLFRALALWQRLNQAGFAVELRAVGHTPRRQDLSRLRQLVAESGFSDRFRLIGGMEPVSFGVIVAHVRAATAGLALYTPNPAIRPRIPTKFYTYLANQTPVLFSDVPAWRAFNLEHTIGAPAPQRLEDQVVLLREWLGTPPLIPAASPAAYGWASEKPKLIRFYAALLGEV